MKRMNTSLLASIFVIAASLSWAESAPDLVDYFADNGFGGTVGSIQHPSGEHYKGVTYVAYQGPYEDPYVASYNHRTRKWAGPYKAGVSLLGKDKAETFIDDHGKPAMVVDAEGYIHVVFGGHGGLKKHGKNPLGVHHSGKMIHVVTKKPLDISSWQVLNNIPPFGTYNQLVKMDNGDLYLFYRHGAHQSDWVYQRSADNGRTFKKPVSILKTKKCKKIRASDAWYGWFVKSKDNTIIAAYNYHLCKAGNHNGERHNGYYMEMSTKDHSWHNVKGESIKVPVTKEYADRMTLVVDTKDLWSLAGTTALDSKGNPHVTFAIDPDPSCVNVFKNGQLQHFRWTGNSWTDGSYVGLPRVTYGSLLVSSPEKVSLLLAPSSFPREIAWWHSRDGGKEFIKGEVLLSQNKGSFKFTSLILNAHPDARVIVAKKNNSTDFSIMSLLGDQGLIKRPQAEANQLSEKDKAKKKVKK